jgi:hypothetical protein
MPRAQDHALSIDSSSATSEGTNYRDRQQSMAEMFKYFATSHGGSEVAPIAWNNYDEHTDHENLMPGCSAIEME